MDLHTSSMAPRMVDRVCMCLARRVGGNGLVGAPEPLPVAARVMRASHTGKRPRGCGWLGDPLHLHLLALSSRQMRRHQHSPCPSCPSAPSYAVACSCIGASSPAPLATGTTPSFLTAADCSVSGIPGGHSGIRSPWQAPCAQCTSAGLVLSVHPLLCASRDHLPWAPCVASTHALWISHAFPPPSAHQPRHQHTGEPFLCISQGPTPPFVRLSLLQREVTRMVEIHPPSCPYCRSTVRGFGC